MIRLLTSSLIAVVLLSPQIAVAQTDSAKTLSLLKKVQSQAKQDFAMLRGKYSNQTYQIVTSVLAQTPILLSLFPEEVPHTPIHTSSVKETVRQPSIQTAAYPTQKSAPLAVSSSQVVPPNKVKLDFPPYLAEALNQQDKDLLIKSVEEKAFALYYEVTNNHTPAVLLYDKEAAPILKAIQDNDTKQALAALDKAFPSLQTQYRYSVLIPFDENTARREIVQQLADDLSLFPKSKAERLVLTKEYMHKLNTLFIHGKSSSKLLAKNLAKYILSRSGLLSMGLLAGTVAYLANAPQAQAAQIAQAQRLVQHPELFINATSDELQEIAQHPFVANTALEIAWSLQIANQLPPQDIEALYQRAQQPSKEIKKALIHSLQNVSAH